MERIWKLIRILRAPANVPFVVLAVSMVAAAATILVNARHMWFTDDDWDFLLHRGTVPDASRGFFAPHNEHPSMAVIVVFRLLFSFFGLWNAPYAVTQVLFHLALVGCVVVSLLRSGTSRWIAAGVGITLAFVGAGADGVLWYTVISLVGSMLAGWALMTVLTKATGIAMRELVLSWALLTLSWWFSGVGVSVAVFVAAYVWMRHGWRLAAIVAAVPGGLFLLWFAVIGHTGSEKTVGGPALLRLPEYIWVGLTSPYTASTGIPQSGTLIVIAAVVSLFAPSVPHRLKTLAWAGLVGGIAQLALSGSGRLATLGIDQASSGRYAYLTLVFLAPTMASLLVALSRVVVPSPVALRIVAAVGLVAYCVNGAYQLREYVNRYEPYSTADRNLAYGLQAAAAANEKVLTKQQISVFKRDFDASLLVKREISRELPRRTATPEQRIAAEGMFMVGVKANSDFKMAQPGTLKVVYGFTPAIRKKPGCHKYVTTIEGPVLSLQSVAGNEIVVWSNTSEVTTQLVRGADKSALRKWAVPKNKPVHIATTARDAELVIGFNGTGEFTICRL